MGESFQAFAETVLDASIYGAGLAVLFGLGCAMAVTLIRVIWR